MNSVLKQYVKHEKMSCLFPSLKCVGDIIVSKLAIGKQRALSLDIWPICCVIVNMVPCV